MAVTQQEVMQAWIDWMLSYKVSREMAERIIAKGPLACYMLWDVAHA